MDREAVGHEGVGHEEERRQQKVENLEADTCGDSYPCLRY